MSRLILKNYGGSYQLKIENADDFEKIYDLSDARWAATSIPIDSLNCDTAFLSYVDTDKNGRIRTDELKAAQGWLFKYLANRSRLSEESDVLILDDIDTSHPEGKKIYTAAKSILANLDLPDAREISLIEVRDRKTIMANAAGNGDGIIPPEAASKADLSRFIGDVMETVGSRLDAGGKPGIGEGELQEFLAEAEAYLNWRAKGEIPKGKKFTEIMPWGKETGEAFESVARLEEKIEQYFTQCDMVTFDGQASTRMQLRQKELEEMDFSDVSTLKARLKEAPLSSPNARGILYLEKMINPLYAESLNKLKDNVLKRALGRLTKQLNREDWNKVKAIFIPYRDWLESKEGNKVEKLGIEKLRFYLKGSYKHEISNFISRDQAVAENLSQIDNLEKLILYQRWLMNLANNFVNFRNLYDPECRALFETGKLVIDGREMTFTLKVRNRDEHKKIARDSFIYLMYLEITGRRDQVFSPGSEESSLPGQGTSFEIVTAVTAGSVGRLRIGKRGIFFTTDGQEWDAQVVDIVKNPISLWESVKEPFQQFSSFIKDQVDKFTQSRKDKLEGTVSQAGPSGIARDLLLGGGIAIAALGSAFAYVTKVLSQVRLIHIAGVFLSVLVIILLPGLINGFIKLRKRDMSVILEASDWAVNVRMRLSASLGALFTRLPALPKGACKKRRDLLGQFVKKIRYSSFDFQKTPRLILIVLFIFVLVVFLIFHFKGSFYSIF